MRPVAPDTNYQSLITAFVALGSNLEDPVAKIRGGLAAIGKLPLTRLVRSSSFYRNPPVGILDQPDFVNAAAMIETGLGPRELLGALLGIESAHGRARSVPNAPRTLDLDLALYGERVIEEPGLVVPHPRLAERAFVLIPIAEIAPDAVVPGRGRIADLVQAVDAAGMVKVIDTGSAG
jgi:2-amino-4-hydroxy-6-hydroxymethyldihydropteridine diphosphokinase